VGRLDADSTGALILTNDGDLTFRLTHPRHEIPKIYQVWVAGTPTPAVLAQWQQGVYLDQNPTLPAEVKILQKEPEKTLLKITIREGKNRQIRRVAAQLGYPVISLHRIAIGIIQLPHPHQPPLPSGEYRQLTTQEVKFLQEE
jgi:23S rRNA pseudouridine2605 synthase